MTLKEFEDKYGTKIPVDIQLRNVAGGEDLGTITGERFVAGLGDLIKDYQEHLMMNFWEKYFEGISNSDWNIVEKTMRERLNEIKLYWDSTRLTQLG